MSYYLFLLYFGLFALFLGGVGGCASMSVPAGTTAATQVSVTTTQVPATTTTPANPCNAPDNNSAGITIDEGTGIQDTGTTEPAIAHCTSCDSGDRTFYTSATDPDPSNAQANNQVAASVVCTPTSNLCLCNADGICCTPLTGANPPDQVNLVPYCDGNGCKMNAQLQGDGTSGLTCTNSKSFTVDGQLDAGGNFEPMNSGFYFQADSVSCSGCTAIQDDVCMGPTLNGPA